mmetsp:Transcript_76298/g.218206  ORF Transcript_76298/g.218206 Transcript_76298/m.218206 type:complete len:103 (+) Transcript_76298:3078-3386(+)
MRKMLAYSNRFLTLFRPNRLSSFTLTPPVHRAMRKMLAYSKKFLERRREMRKQGIIVEKRASTKVKKGRVFNRTATMDRSPDLTKSPGKSPGVLDRVYGGGV